MPFYFHFNLREELGHITDNPIVKRLLTKKKISKVIDLLKNLRIKDLTILSKLAKHPYRFQRAMNYVAFGSPGDDVPAPATDEPPTLIKDYQKWSNGNSSLTSSDESYFVIKENFLRDFVKKLDNEGLYLIVKFGCDSDGKNLSILLAGMAKRDDTKMSDSYIECNSSTYPPKTVQNFSDTNAATNFKTRISNFHKRLPTNIDPKEVGVAHNTKTIYGAANGKGFLDYYLNKYMADESDEDIYIHPAWDSNHQNNFTVIFAGKTDLINRGDWDKVYDYGQACCPPQ